MEFLTVISVLAHIYTFWPALKFSESFWPALVRPALIQNPEDTMVVKVFAPRFSMSSHQKGKLCLS